MSGHIPTVSIYHIAELYLYEYYVNRDEYTISDTDLAASHISEAERLEKGNNPGRALVEWISAHAENPVSMQIYEGIIRCNMLLQNKNGVLKYTKEIYPFCCTRSELAFYYRSLGWYYLEDYKPELSAALYRYSTFFYESAQAEEEIRYLEKAMKRPLAEGNAESLQKVISDADIPVFPDSTTLALLLRAGEEAESRDAVSQALDCYHMIYDLTHDAEVEERIHRLSD